MPAHPGQTTCNTLELRKVRIGKRVSQMPSGLDVDLLDVARRVAAADSDTVMICLFHLLPAMAEVPPVCFSASEGLDDVVDDPLGRLFTCPQVVVDV